MLILLFSWLIQVFVFNHLGNFISYLPYFGLISIILFPFKTNETLYLVYAFVAGLLMDTALGTGGVFASAAVTFAFLRNIIIKRIKPEWMERNLTVASLPLNTAFFYILITSVSVTLLVYVFDSGRLSVVFAHTGDILKHGLLNGFFYFIFTIFFHRNKITQTV